MNMYKRTYSIIFINLIFYACMYVGGWFVTVKNLNYSKYVLENNGLQRCKSQYFLVGSIYAVKNL